MSPILNIIILPLTQCWPWRTQAFLHRTSNWFWIQEYLPCAWWWSSLFVIKNSLLYPYLYIVIPLKLMCLVHLESHKQPFIKIFNSYFNPESIDITLLKRFKKIRIFISHHPSGNMSSNLQTLFCFCNCPGLIFTILHTTSPWGTHSICKQPLLLGNVSSMSCCVNPLDTTVWLSVVFIWLPEYSIIHTVYYISPLFYK